MAAVMEHHEAVSQQENDENIEPANAIAAYPVEALQVRAEETCCCQSRERQQHVAWEPTRVVDNICIYIM